MELKPRAQTPSWSPLPWPAQATTKEEIIAEVEADLKAVEAYLVDAVFEAAGFRAYRQQELEKLWNAFINEKGTWDGVVMTERQNENPRLVAELPDSLRSQTFDIEVANRLRQLRIAIGEADAGK